MKKRYGLLLVLASIGMTSCGLFKNTSEESLNRIDSAGEKAGGSSDSPSSATPGGYSDGYEIGEGGSYIDSSKETTSDSEYAYESGDAPIEGGKTSDGGMPVEDTPAVGPIDPINPNPRARLLTAASYDDNEEYEYWLGLNERNQEGKCYFDKYKELLSFNTFNRIELTLPKFIHAKVELLNSQNEVIFTAFSKRDGKAYLFPEEHYEQANVRITYLNKDNEEVSVIKEIKDGDEITLESLENKANSIDLMFVIDATGSMGDEMNYINVELNDVISKVQQLNPNTNILTSCLVYRDKGDEYLTRYSDFTSRISDTNDFISNQYASGGGDYEEAVDVAMTEAVNKQWGTGSSTKLIFHVADAPAHHSDFPTWNKAVIKAAEKDITVCSVVCSGASKDAEYGMRSQALLTGGKYIYLTNDSGIGGYHADPNVKEKPVVEYLNECLIRTIDGYHNGVFQDPVPANTQKQ